MGEDSKHANRIDAREKFDNALESLVTDSCRAWDHWMVLLHLNEARGEYGREMAQSPIFWNTILRSLQDGAILRMATMVDGRDDVVSECFGSDQHPRARKWLDVRNRTQGFRQSENRRRPQERPPARPFGSENPEGAERLHGHRSINIVATQRINLLPDLANEELDGLRKGFDLGEM